MKPSRVILPLITLGLLACGGSGIMGPSPELLTGTWVRMNEVPGSGEQWQLTVQGSSIGGSGSWTGEACCAGTISLAGRIAGDSIHVDATYTTTYPTSRPAFQSHFDGVLKSPTVMEGMGSRSDGFEAPQRFQKVIPR